mgnify:CR=1 FL=1
MIIYNDRRNKKNSKYICDRCKKELTVEDKIAIYAENKKNKKKKWDFCSRCYRSLERGVVTNDTRENNKR